MFPIRLESARFLSRSCLLIGVTFFFGNVSSLASSSDSLTSKREKQVERIKKLRHNIFELFTEKMDEMAKVADDSDHHNEAALLSAVYILSIPQMLCADMDFISFFDPNTKDTIFAPEPSQNKIKRVKKSRNDFVLKHNTCLRQNKSTYGHIYERENIYGIEIPDVKVDMISSFDRDFSPSYFCDENFDLDFFNLIKFSDRRIGKVFWLDNDDIAHIFKNILKRESLGSFQVRSAPECVITSGDFRTNYSFTLDLLFESAYKLLKQDADSFIEQTYERFLQIVSEKDDAFIIDHEYVPKIVNEDYPDNCWIKFINDTISKTDKNLKVAQSEQS